MQLFLSYGVMGSIFPFLTVYLKQGQGLTEGQIGIILGVASVSVLITPVWMTLLADTRFDPRRLVSVVLGISALALLTLNFSAGFWPVMVLLTFHSLAHAAMIPLHDGITFSTLRRRELEKQPLVPYHRIRVWGTIGFILPSLILFWLIRNRDVDVILLCGVGFSVIALLHAFRLRDPRPERDGKAPLPERSGLPTSKAVRTLLQPNVRIFCLALFLAYTGMSGFGSFQPLYLVEHVGVGPEWVGLIIGFGVAVEIFFVLAFGRLHAWLGFRRLMITGIGCLGTQTLLMALFPSVAVAIAVQVVHGMVILAMFIAPVMYINRQAGDHFRNSIQGLFAMAVIGIARISGVVLAGQLAGIDLRVILFATAGLCFASIALFIVGFREETVSEKVGLHKAVP